MNLYVHFPFCRSKCAYCALRSRSGASKAERSAYVARIVEEIGRVAREIHTVYFGGGTPALCDLRPACAAVRAAMGTVDEFTVELNPCDVTPALLDDLREGGVNRISMGVQSLDDGILRAMGASPLNIRKIFMWEAMIIATLGIVLGLLLAGLLCWIIATFDIVELPGDIYYLTKVPVRMQLWDIIAVIGGSYFICFIAGLYPAIKASRVQPTDAIRYG